MMSVVSERVQQALDLMGRERLIGIVRTDAAESCEWASRCLIEAGIRLIEIPFTVPDATGVIERLCERFPDAVIGAGTVLEAREALNALGAGAKFLVSPILNEPMIQFGLEQEIPVLPGCATPTEIYRAWTLGAPAVKFFPAQPSGGADFIRALKGPLPQIPVVPTGGIEKAHVGDYLKAGALAVGVGNPLIPKWILQSRNEAELKKLAGVFREQIQ